MNKKRLWLIVTLGLAMLGCIIVVVLVVFVAPPTPPSKVPVLVVPRFNGGSEPVAGQAERFVTHRGFDPRQLSLGDSYRPLFSALEAKGYRNGVTLFPSTYDWRMPGAPEQVGTPDGTVSLDSRCGNRVEVC